ncbi:MAG: hypothetical protein KAU95_02490, partial [Candidatus Aenigmarchaeota archaeon]|nr:hypothetical protein [Candidatus Aenigmarchaeota archaeon]
MEINKLISWLILVIVLIFPIFASEIYSQKIESIPKAFVDINISIENSTTANITLFYKGFNEYEWKYCNLTNQSCSFPSSYLTEQTIYKYYFNYSSNGTEKRFPNGSFSIALSAGEECLKENATNF